MISIIIPVYNNRSTLQELTDRIANTLSDKKHEIIYINDGSTDESLMILKEIAKKYKQVRVVAFSRNFGQHPAISAGFELARGEKIILMDADLQDRPENIPLLLNRLKNGIDIVYTVRQDKQKMFLRNITSNLFHYFLSRQSQVKMPRNIGTFSLFNRKVLDALLQYREVNILYGPLMYYIGFNCSYIEIERDASPDRKSSYSFLKRFELGLNTIITYTDLPHKVFSYTGLFILFSSIIYAAIVIVQYLFLGRILPSGLTIIIVLLLFMLGSIMFSIGILGIYLFRIFQEVLRRPRYLINEIIENKPENENERN